MALKDMLLRRAAASGNLGNPDNESEVTEIKLTEQRGSLGNPGNPQKTETPDEGGAEAPATGKNPHATAIIYEVTEVTQVTSMKDKGNSGNLTPSAEVTRGYPRLPAEELADPPATPDDPDPRRRPVPGGLVDRVLKAGGETSIGGHRPDGRLWKFAYLPDDIGPGLVAELKADGWSISAVEEMRKYVADTMRRARMAVSNLTDADRGQTS